MFLWIQFKMGQRFHAGYVNSIYKKGKVRATSQRLLLTKERRGKQHSALGMPEGSLIF